MKRICPSQWRSKARVIRTYARIAAVVLLAVAVAGLTILSWRTSEVFYHGGLDLLFAYAGFWQRDTTAVRMMVRGPGMLMLGHCVAPQQVDPSHLRTSLEPEQ